MAPDRSRLEEGAGDLSVSQELPMSFQWVPKVTQEKHVVLNSHETTLNQLMADHFSSKQAA